MPSESFRRHFYVRHMNDAAKSAACAPKVKYGECKKKWHGTPFYNGVGWVDKPNVSDGLWICWVDNPTYPPYHFFMHFTIGISDGLQDSINLNSMPCTIHAYDYAAKSAACAPTALLCTGQPSLQLRQIFGFIPIQKNNLTSLSRLAVLSVLSAARRLVSLLFWIGITKLSIWQNNAVW